MSNPEPRVIHFEKIVKKCWKLEEKLSDLLDEDSASILHIERKLVKQTRQALFDLTEFFQITEEELDRAAQELQQMKDQQK